MKLLEFLPLILFFIVYKMDPRQIEVMGEFFELGGIFSATAILICATIIVYGLVFIRNKTLDKNQCISLVAVLIFGALTISFRNELFLKWKAPVVNWIFGVILLFSQFVGKEPVMKRFFGEVLSLPDSVWWKLNMAWALFFIALGTANLYVAYNYEKIWVDFKIFGSLGLTLLFVIIQTVFLAPYIKQSNIKQDSKQG